jgi:hypothetical protein
MARPGSPTEPVSKKARMSPSRPSTRSQTQQQADIVLSSDDDDDGELFEYESYDESVGMEQDVEEEVDELADDEDMSGDGKEVLVLSSDPEEEGTPEAPPELPKGASKGKMSARKQFAADVGTLVERFGGSSDPTVQSQSNTASSSSSSPN